MTFATQSETCFNAITDLDEVMHDALPQTTYFIVGGIATAAYQHEGTFFDPEEQVAYADVAADVPVLRPNKTLRDVDILVASVLDPEESLHAKRVVEKAVDGRLEVSLFGFDPYETTITNRFELLSRRLQNRAGECFYKMGAAVQYVPAETYQQPWQLALPDGARVNALHPVGHTLAYKVRSAGGLRGKDHEKHTAMTQNIAQKLGSTAVAEAEAQFASWREFANTLDQIRSGNYDQLSALSLRPDASWLELRALRWQGRTLGALERQERLVSIAQSPLAQRMLKRAIGSV
jgi:hypothetical protein